MRHVRQIAILITLCMLSACSNTSRWDSAYSGVSVGEVIDMEAD
jgi:hypothetical protein